MMNQQYAPPPPYSAPAHQPIGFEQPPPVSPFNAIPQQGVSPQYPYGGPPQQHPYAPPPQQYPYAPQQTTADPLIQQQARVAALNATPRPYYSGWRGSQNRTKAMILFGVIALTMVIVFLVLFFTIFNKAHSDFAEVQKRQEEFRNKHFSNW